jgi:hypothetical protein
MLDWFGAAKKNYWVRAALAGAIWFTGMAAARLLGLFPHADRRDDGAYLAVLLAVSAVFGLSMSWFVDANARGRKRSMLFWGLAAVSLIAIYALLKYTTV